MQIKDRIVEFCRVPESELIPNPKNWRKHPKGQAEALKGMLSDVGIAGAVLARRLEDNSLMIIDGHLRKQSLKGLDVPVLVLDVTEEEADKILATYDPIGEMAEKSNASLMELLKTISSENNSVVELLSNLYDSTSQDLIREMASAAIEGEEEKDRTVSPLGTVNVPVTSEEELVIRKAIAKAKKEFKGEDNLSSGSALAIIAQEFLDGED